jgi:hypothetical protein
MKLSQIRDRFSGRWTGSNTLHTSWLPVKEHRSETTLIVAPVASGMFLAFAYTWSHDGAAHEGLLLVGNENDEEEAVASFVDSWHMSGSIMPSNGTVSDDGVIQLLGSYSAPPDADWGWRIEVRSDAHELRIDMFNISPEGDEDIAVRAEYKRASS